MRGVRLNLHLRVGLRPITAGYTSRRPLYCTPLLSQGRIRGSTLHEGAVRSYSRVSGFHCAAYLSGPRFVLGRLLGYNELQSRACIHGNAC
jgi:hypothetical protein